VNAQDWTALAVALVGFIATIWTVRSQTGGLREQLHRQLSFEGDRDKRQIYASTLAALKKYEIEPSAETETAARVAVSEVALVARHHVWSAAEDEFANLLPVPGEKDSDRSARCRQAWDRMVRVMRADIGVSEEWTSR
jgi:hypothetical protein